MVNIIDILRIGRLLRTIESSVILWFVDRMFFKSFTDFILKNAPSKKLDLV